MHTLFSAISLSNLPMHTIVFVKVQGFGVGHILVCRDFQGREPGVIPLCDARLLSNAANCHMV